MHAIQLLKRGTSEIKNGAPLPTASIRSKSQNACFLTETISQNPSFFFTPIKPQQSCMEAPLLALHLCQESNCLIAFAHGRCGELDRVEEFRFRFH